MLAPDTASDDVVVVICTRQLRRTRDEKCRAARNKRRYNATARFFPVSWKLARISNKNDDRNFSAFSFAGRGG